jgi:hypothetical protein
MSGKKTPAYTSSSTTGRRSSRKLSLKSVRRDQTLAQQQRTDDKVAEVRRYNLEPGVSAHGDWTESHSDDSSETNSRSSVHEAGKARKGRGVIDRFQFQASDYRRKTSTAKRKPTITEPTQRDIVVGPASGLPPPRPDPRLNPPVRDSPRTSRILTERGTWTGVSIREGIFEWSRVNESGHQEWLTASDDYKGEWTLTRTKATKR